MATEKIVYDIDVNSEGAEQAVKGLNTEMKGLDATFEDVYGDIKPLTGRMGELEDRMYELAQAGDTTSNEFKQLSNEASRLKNVQKEVDLQLDRTSRTMTEKFNSGVSLVTGSMVLAEGAMSALGVSADESEAVMANMFQTLAVGQALLQVEEVTGWFSTLIKAILRTTVVTKALTLVQYLWNTAIAANPIGAIVAGIGLLITGIISVTSWMSISGDEAKKAARKTRDLADANKELQRSLDGIDDSYDRLRKTRETSQKQAVALAKIQGATSKELQDMEEKNRKINLKAAEAAYKAANSLNISATDKEGMALKSKLLARFQKEKETYAAQEVAIVNKYLLLEAQAKVTAAAEDEAIKKAAADKTKREKDAEEAEEAQRKLNEAEAELERLEEFLTKQEEIVSDARQKRMEGDKYKYFEAKRNEKARHKEVLSDLLKAKEKGLITEDEYNSKVRSAVVMHNAAMKGIEDTETTRKESAQMTELSKELNNINTSFERKKEILLAQRKWILENTEAGSEEQFTAIKRLDAETAALEQAEYQRKLGNAAKIAQMAATLISSIQTMQRAQFDEENKNGKQDEKSKEKRSKRQFEAQKKLNIGMAVVNASQAIISSLASAPVAFGGVPNPIGIASLAVATASGIASIAAISKATYGGGGSGSRPIAAPSSPTFNVVGQSAPSVDSQTEVSAQELQARDTNPQRAFVVSTDITSQQALDREIEGQSTLG